MWDGGTGEEKERKDPMDRNEIEAKLKAAVNEPHQFSAYNNIFLTRAMDGEAEGMLYVNEYSLNPHGMVHGGALAALADTVAGSCANSKRGNTCVTTNSTMEFLRPGTAPWIRCTATTVKSGRTLSVVALRLTDSEERLVATGTYTFCMMEFGDARLHPKKEEKSS